jgi:DNA end-binding protein Ku
MPRPIWKGQISFGLVNIPVVLYPAESSRELHFSLIDDRTMARVKYKRVDESTGEEVPWDHVVKAYERDDGEYIVLSDEDFARADVEATQTVEIEDFVEIKNIPFTYFDKPYYLVPGKKGEKGYVLLRETLKRTGKVGIAKVVIRTKQYLAALLPQERGLILDLLRYQYELRDISQFDLPGNDIDDYKISDREIDMAASLVESMTTDWTPEKYRDDYRDALLAWIEKKAKEGAAVEAPPPKPTEPRGEIIDFMDLLKRSVDETEKARGKTEEKPGPKPKRKRAGGR